MSKSIDTLKKEAWKLMSEFVRRRDKGVCCTCGDKRSWKEQNAGHFIHGKLDFEFLNVHCQCVRCNKWLHGNLCYYGGFIVKTYGAKKLLTLLETGRKPKQEYVSEYLNRTIRVLRRKLKALNAKEQL
jgi:hypothetical protein